MGSGALTPLQIRMLQILADLEPRWTLTGGGALVGFHLHHRATRDLDLFLHGQRTLEDYAARVSDRLQSQGLGVQSLQTGTSMHRLQVDEGGESVVLDLVAEPVPVVEPPLEVSLGNVSIRVDGRHEILVNKLCALIQRSELRDLVDVHRLLDSGGDLRRALEDAPRKDSGFSPLALAWSLKELPMSAQAKAEGWPEDRIESLEGFRNSFLAALADLTRPETD